MKFNLRFLFILFILIAFLCGNVFAQYPGMAAFRAQQNQQFINQQMQMMSQLMNMRGVQSSMLEYDFLVVLRDSSKKEVTSAIYYDTVSKNRFIVFVDKKYKKSDTNRYKKIFPYQTVYIAKEITPMAATGHGASKQATKPILYPGICKDSCWMYKVTAGTISAYSDVFDDEGMYFYPSTIVGIQYKDGPIVKYNEENLKQMVGQDINALEAIEKKNFYKAIKKYNRDVEKENKK